LPEVSKGVAVVEFKPDNDGVLRRTKPLREYQGNYFPVLGLAPFVDSHTPITIHDGLITINDRKIPVDENGNSLINMYGLNNIETYSMSGVFKTLQQLRKGTMRICCYLLKSSGTALYISVPAQLVLPT